MFLREASRDFRFLVRAGDKVKVGEPLGETLGELERRENNELRRFINLVQRERDLRRAAHNHRRDRQGWFGAIGAKLKIRRNRENHEKGNAARDQQQQQQQQESDLENEDDSKEQVWFSRAGELVDEWLFRFVFSFLDVDYL